MMRIRAAIEHTRSQAKNLNRAFVIEASTSEPWLTATSRHEYD